MVKVSHSQRSRLAYAVLDEQSNRSLATSSLLDGIGMNTEKFPYTLTSCTDTFQIKGRRAVGIVVESMSQTARYELPSLFECDHIPDERSEIPTPEVAECFPHLCRIAKYLQPLDPNVHIELLIGRDLPEAFHIREQLTGPRNTPFAQHLNLGWAIIGDVCLGDRHKPIVVNVNKTNVLKGGRGTIFDLCMNNILLKEHAVDEDIQYVPSSVKEDLGKNVFVRSRDDKKVGTSVEDREFVHLMESTFRKDETGHWTAPLPFRSPRPELKNNRQQAWTRAKALDASLRRDPVKKEHFFTFMSKVLKSGAAEVAPPPVEGNEYWYLPLFGVYHPRKPSSIRGVFDSSAKYAGMALNSVLLQGPDLTNNLFGILLRFREDRFAISVDVEQMFYQFHVDEDCRDFLRFFWYGDNNMENDLIEHRMCVHVFGNSPSPAVATYGLRKSVEKADSDVRKFVQRNFYVDDGLTSSPEKDGAVDLLQRTQRVLKDEGKLRLHKVASNCRDVLLAFPKEDLGKELQNINFEDPSETLPLQGCLGLQWNLNKGCFVFGVIIETKPFTRRGILSTLNSVFDPLGFLSPLLISGKILLRELSPSGTDWDEPLSPLQESEWERWKRSMLLVKDMEVPRMIVPSSVSRADNVEIHIYSDASEKAIAAVAYLRTFDSRGNSQTGFIMGKSKLAPSRGNTIPRLELCGAVLAIELWELIEEHFDVVTSTVHFYTDSKVTLGYINNRSRRFYTYVCNRVERIHRSSTPNQWNYVPTELNPADAATRFITDVDGGNMALEKWLAGPTYLFEKVSVNGSMSFPIELPDEVPEIRPEAILKKTNLESPLSSVIDSADRFSTWNSFMRAICILVHIAKTFCDLTTCTGWHVCKESTAPNLQHETQCFILSMLQKKHFLDEISALQDKKTYI